jgi:MFS family permease
LTLIDTMDKVLATGQPIKEDVTESEVVFEQPDELDRLIRYRDQGWYQDAKNRGHTVRSPIMLFRFCLYGFLKNQRYFEPFLILVFLEKGLSFFLIGLLIAFREAAVNLLEIPSGGIADVCGKRKSMMLSFAAYIASFLVFGLAQHLGLLFAAMFLFAIGEAFRSGTHKAMIFTWLRLQGREDERTRVYGYTRSWSKFGSALSVVLAALFVFVGDSYTYIFYFSIVPYALNIVNFMGYPQQLEGEQVQRMDLGQVMRHLRETFKTAYTRVELRRLIVESVGFDGVFESAKDYLQPVLKIAAVALAAHWMTTGELSEIQQSVFLVGPVYFVLYLLSGVASRQAHRVVKVVGQEEGAARFLWGVDLFLFIALALAAFGEVNAVLIAAFVLLHALQNLWRPILLSRLDSCTSEAQGATILSIESQARRTATIVVAPLLGLAVDAVQAHQFGGAFWPAGVLGATVALAFFLMEIGRRGKVQMQ